MVFFARPQMSSISQSEILISWQIFILGQPRDQQNKEEIKRLTLNIEDYALADAGWYSVFSDAQIGPGIGPADLWEDQLFSILGDNHTTRLCVVLKEMLWREGIKELEMN